MNKSALQEIAEELGYDVRSYSGRAMYGKECLGIVSDNSISEMLCDMLAFFIEDYDVKGNLQHEMLRFLDNMRCMRSDNMGLSMVYYWPSVNFVEDEVEDDDDDDDDVPNV